MAKFFSTNVNPDNPANRLIKEIEGMEFKKSSLVSAIQNEITATKQKIDNELYQIGVDMYANHMENVKIDDKLAAHFAEIANLNELIAEKEAKKNDIINRYDDEINMMRSTLNIPAASVAGMPNAAPVQGAATCTACGKPFTPGVDMFCMGCGAKLDSPVPVSGGGAFCENCGRPYTPVEDAFCMGCGQKL